MYGSLREFEKAVRSPELRKLDELRETLTAQVREAVDRFRRAHPGGGVTEKPGIIDPWNRSGLVELLTLTCNVCDVECKLTAQTGAAASPSPTDQT